MARRRREQQRTWGPARFIAPGAFLLAVTIAVLIVRGGLAEDEATPVTTATTVATTTAPATTTRKPKPRRGGTTTATPRAQFYAIQEGDTLDLVALKHDTSVEALLELNPGVDTNSLQIGQRIRVK